MAMFSPAVRRKVAVAMSGGVDSSVAAYLLLCHHSKQHHQQGVEICGLHMTNWNQQDDDDDDKATTRRCHEQDMNDAQKVCEHLDIPLHRANFAPEYWTFVFEPFLEGLEHNRTPNPDIYCNSTIKFGAMKEYAMKRLGADAVATGHYARLWHRDEKEKEDAIVEEMLEHHSDLADWLPSYEAETPLLLSAADGSKDQSYFLSHVDGNAFRNVLFPLGDLFKQKQQTPGTQQKTVRQLAEEANLPTAFKKDSMGICFIGKRNNFGNFISQYTEHNHAPGDFVDVDTGAIVGQHEGTLQYTIGQGARISGASQKWFVVEKDSSTVWVCAGTKHPALFSDELYIQSLHWIVGSAPLPLRQTGRMRAQCRTRHLQPLTSCEILAPMAGKGGLWTIRFDQPVRGITPGQMAALYVGDGLVCLGGGAIFERGASYHEKGLPLSNDLSHKERSITQQQQEIAIAGG
jgi:tRNA U34 2-thiouridine synthase MnmA/TrmU